MEKRNRVVIRWMIAAAGQNGLAAPADVRADRAVNHEMPVTRDWRHAL
jgi:hypothetical protein